MTNDDTPRRIPLAQLTERLSAEQERQYARLLSDAVRQIEELFPEGFDKTKRSLIEDLRSMLAADLERFARRLSAVAARGARVDEPLH